MVRRKNNTYLPLAADTISLLTMLLHIDAPEGSFGDHMSG